MFMMMMMMIRPALVFWIYPKFVQSLL